MFKLVELGPHCNGPPFRNIIKLFHYETRTVGKLVFGISYWNALLSSFLFATSRSARPITDVRKIFCLLPTAYEVWREGTVFTGMCHLFCPQGCLLPELPEGGLLAELLPGGVSFLSSFLGQGGVWSEGRWMSSHRGGGCLVMEADHLPPP